VNYNWRFPHLLLGKTIRVLCDNYLKLLNCPSHEDAKIQMCSACLILIHHSIQPTHIIPQFLLHILVRIHHQADMCEQVMQHIQSEI